jgi:PBSX family phage terminase large subunit
MTNLDKLYTKKQQSVLRYYYNNDFSILILHGAKRAGKTVLDIDLFISELRRIRKIADEQNVICPQYILAGASLGSVRRNIINELENRYGLTIKLNIENAFFLFGVKVCCFGHDDIGCLGVIRGMTAWGAFVNEGTMANREVFDEIVSRCSAGEAKVLVDTNPGDPLHWLKVDYVDKADNKTIAEFSFQLEDNTFLTQRYIENIKTTTPSGVFYDRNIKGRWVTPEGVVYADFDHNKHVINSLDGFNFVKYVVGVDWGYEHNGVIVIFGITDKGEFVLIKEIARQHQDVDSFWLPKALKIKELFGDVVFYCDSARPEYVEKFINAGLNACNANKSVLEGITDVATLIKTGKFFVYSKGIANFEKEIYSYVWADGKDEPVKKNDDTMDGVRYAIHSELSDFDKAIAIEGIEA